MRPARTLTALACVWALGCSRGEPVTPEPVQSSGATQTPSVAPADAASGPVDAGGGTDAPATTDGPAGASGEASALYQQAVAAFGRNDLQTAARLFSEAWDRSPSVELAFNAGRAYERLGDVENGTRFFQRVLDGSPSATLRADVTARMASLRDFERRSREGFAQLPPASDAIAREAMTWFQRGITAFRGGRYQVALQAFEAARQYNADLPELAFNLAMTHERMHHNGEAVAGFQTYLGLRPDAPDRARIEARIRELQH